MTKIKTRFAPSPTGSLHVGGARTALFSYALARKLGGSFLLRIEDTDQARHQEEAVEKIVADLRWLGIEWDEGVDVGGAQGPYRQSERLEIYQTATAKLLDAGKAYHAFETADELDALRAKAEAEKRGFKYERPATFPTADDVAKARAEGRPVVVRFACPGHDVRFRDEVFGEIVQPADECDDFIIQKADGWPTYHLANVVDDAAMGVTFILRGQEFVGQTWRHVLLREALGADEPQYAHLPLIMDMQGRKLSKRDGDVEVDSFRAAGYLPEALVNFLALLGWNPGDGRETFGLDEFVEMFGLDRISKSNAKFDRDKLLAFNTSAASAMDDGRLLAAFKDFLSCNETPFPAGDDDLLRRLLQACAGFRTFADVVAKAGVLFVANNAYDFDPQAVRKALAKGDGAGYAVLEAVREPLESVEWTPDAIEAWIRDYCQANGLGMGKVAQPIRVAVTGTMISPGLGDTLSLLGRENSLVRIERCLRSRRAV